MCVHLRLLMSRSAHLHFSGLEEVGLAELFWTDAWSPHRWRLWRFSCQCNVGAFDVLATGLSFSHMTPTCSWFRISLVSSICFILLVFRHPPLILFFQFFIFSFLGALVWGSATALHLQYVFGFPFSLKIVRHRRRRRQTLEGSFSAVWTATIARKDAFFSIFHNLRKYEADSEKFCRPLHQFSNFRQFFQINFWQICKFSLQFAIFRRKFHGFSPEFHRMLGNCSRSLDFAHFSEIS